MPVLRGRVHRLDQQLPLRVVARGDGLEEVLRGVRVVGAADALGLVVEEGLDAAGGLPVELDVGGLEFLRGRRKGGRRERVEQRKEEEDDDDEKTTEKKKLTLPSRVISV